MSNSDNPHIGAEFQTKVNDWFNKNYGATFSEEVKIPIGAFGISKSDYKDHKFDVVSEVRSFVIECKCYTWTNSGNVPSAKMGTMNEAAFYMSLLPPMYKKLIVMRESKSEKHDETLAQYYMRTYKHLLGDIVVAEFDPETELMNFLNGVQGRSRKELINSLAVKYLCILSSPEANEKTFYKDFQQDCFMVGFVMDCGKSFSDCYGQLITDNSNKRNGFETIDDIDILGSGIFSKWRYITHWSYVENCLDEENRRWFVEAFERLKRLTE